MSLLPGLQNYRHDSEISDSEGESSPSHMSLVASGIVSSGLGIPTGHSKEPITPPTFMPPSVKSAPAISLVGYDNEEDASVLIDSVSDETYNEYDRQPLAPSLMTLVNRHGPVQSIEDDIMVDSSQSSDHSREPIFFTLRDIELPSEPSGLCSSALQDKLRTHFRKKRQLGVSPYDVIIKGKSFRNPSIYEKLIQLCGIDEFGTNFDQDFFDPKEWKKDEFYEKLAETQKKAHENKMKSRGKIEFKSGTKLPPTAVKPVDSNSGGGGLLPLPNITVQQDLSKKRRSKWDNPLHEQKKTHGSSPKSNASVGAQALVNARLIDKNLMKIFKS